MGSDGVGELIRHTVAKYQKGYVKAWNKSRGNNGIALHGEDWCDVRFGRVIIIPDGTATEEEDTWPVLSISLLFTYYIASNV